MKRLGLILYLVLATAAGPWYCCCSAARLTAAAVPTADVSVPAEDRAEASCPCCRVVTIRNDHFQIAPAAPPCRCQEHRPPAVSVTAPVLPVDDAHHGPSVPPALVTPSAPALVSSWSRAESASGPFHDTHALLRAFHLLRC